MLPHPEIIAASEVGHFLLIDDGKVKLRVTGKGDGYLDCIVDVAGKISNRKVRGFICFLFWFRGIWS
jgi:pyruvate kinase